MSTIDPVFVANLQHVIDDARALVTAEQQLTQSVANLKSVQKALDEANAEILNKDQALTTANGSIELLQSALSQANAEVERLQAIIDAGPTTPPTPQPARTLFGACPDHNGGDSNKSVNAQLRVYSKYGSTPVTVRQYFATETAPRADKAKVLRLHASWNLSGMATPTAITASWVQTVCANLLAGDRVEVIHEGDKKVTDGKFTYEQVVAMKNKFYDMVKQVRPDLVVVNTLTGGSLADYGADKEERWGAVKADLLGVDCDGVHDQNGPTIDVTYKDEIASSVAFVKKYAANGYKGIIVPEFGMSRRPFDPDGTLRAAWIKAQNAIFVGAGVLEVNLYDYESTPGNEVLPATPEFSEWQKAVRTNVAA